jgi:hypothetical protein
MLRPPARELPSLLRPVCSRNCCPASHLNETCFRKCWFPHGARLRYWDDTRPSEKRNENDKLNRLLQHFCESIRFDALRMCYS